MHVCLFVRYSGLAAVVEQTISVGTNSHVEESIEAEWRVGGRQRSLRLSGGKRRRISQQFQQLPAERAWYERINCVCRLARHFFPLENANGMYIYELFDLDGERVVELISGPRACSPFRNEMIPN